MQFGIVGTSSGSMPFKAIEARIHSGNSKSSIAWIVKARSVEKFLSFGTNAEAYFFVKKDQSCTISFFVRTMRLKMVIQNPFH